MLRPRSLAAAALLAAALPAAAYLLPASAVLRLAAKRRVEVAPGPAELRGTFTSGEGEPVAGVLSLKGGACRFELVGLPERPYAVVRGGRIAPQRGLDRVRGAVALAEGACALLAPTTPDALAQSFAARGVRVQELSLGRLGTRVAYVLGDRAPGAAPPGRPQAWIDKTSLVPLRLVADLAGARRDVQLLDHPPPASAPPGERNPPPPSPAELYPRAIEVSGAEGLEARLAVEKVTPNARLSDALF
jgi:hypothetical protein